MMRQAIFVTGTDTDVGKTVICALLCKTLNAGYWKPIQSGPPRDCDTVKQLTGLPDEYFYPEKYFLSKPLSPHASAKIDGVQIELESLSLPAFTQDVLLIEGAGGVLVPLNEKHLVADLIVHLGTPAIVVARSTLGTINHTLMTLETLRKRGVVVLGVILNGPLNPGNAEAIATYGNTTILAQVEPHERFGQLPHLAPVHANENSRPAIAGAPR